MKKIFLASASLAVFALSISFFQVSCQKEAQAQSGNYVLKPATTSTLGGVIPDGTTISVDENGKISSIGSSYRNLIVFSAYIEDANSSRTEIWTSNLDGTNKKKIPVNVPAGFQIEGNVRLTPDGENIIFGMFSLSSDPSSYISNLYTCKLDGSGLKKIVDGKDIPGARSVDVEGVY